VADHASTLLDLINLAGATSGKIFAASWTSLILTANDVELSLENTAITARPLAPSRVFLTEPNPWESPSGNRVVKLALRCLNLRRPIFCHLDSVVSDGLFGHNAKPPIRINI